MTKYSILHLIKRIQRSLLTYIKFYSLLEHSAIQRKLYLELRATS